MVSKNSFSHFKTLWCTMIVKQLPFRLLPCLNPILRTMHDTFPSTWTELVTDYLFCNVVQSGALAYSDTGVVSQG